MTESAYIAPHIVFALLLLQQQLVRSFPSMGEHPLPDGSA
jgi:hypothetical protein